MVCLWCCTVVGNDDLFLQSAPAHVCTDCSVLFLRGGQHGAGASHALSVGVQSGATPTDEMGGLWNRRGALRLPGAPRLVRLPFPPAATVYSVDSFHRWRSPPVAHSMLHQLRCPALPLVGH